MSCAACHQACISIFFTFDIYNCTFLYKKQEDFHLQISYVQIIVFNCLFMTLYDRSGPFLMACMTMSITLYLSATRTSSFTGDSFTILPGLCVSATTRGTIILRYMLSGRQSILNKKHSFFKSTYAAIVSQPIVARGKGFLTFCGSPPATSVYWKKIPINLSMIF